MSTFKIRNTIMTSVVSAVLVVAAFGIFNVISTVVMEKYKDIAILKAMGFYPSDIKKIFLIQGVILGVIGSCLGVPLGMLFMSLLGLIRFKPPGASQVINMPIDWGMQQFLIAITFAMCASIFAGYFPSRKAGKVQPVDILRGSI
jgi:lipoprotein-releasing system permease protein